MDSTVENTIRELKDRQEIYECLMRYCRGIDRLDRDMLASAYHPDAIDDHGSYAGPVAGFIEYVFALHSTYQQRTQHMITNHICHVDGNTAHTESYYLFRSLNKERPFHSTSSGRYIDRLEKRDGKWGIVARICLVDMRDDGWDPDGNVGDSPFQISARDKTDPSYMRPVKIDSSRYTK